MQCKAVRYYREQNSILLIPSSADIMGKEREWFGQTTGMNTENSKNSKKESTGMHTKMNTETNTERNRENPGNKEKKQAAQPAAAGILRSYRVAEYGMLIALAFVFSYIENLIPVNLGVPGVKLGLANLVTVAGLYPIGIPGTAAVNLVRIVLVGFTFGNPFSMIYSMAGALLSLVLMAVCRKMNWFTPVGVSIIGGVGHNVGQLAVAAFVVENGAVFSYLPVLLIAGTAAGTAIGILGGIIAGRIGRFVAGRDKRI